MTRGHLPHRLDALREACARGETFEYLCFWGHSAAPGETLGPFVLSQWWPARFEVDGVTYMSAEHFMMAEKARLFADSAALARILAAPTPGEAKALGRGVRGFDQAAWEQARFEIVVRGSVAKFGSDARLGDYLQASAARILVEASPRDRIWGIGLSKDDPDATHPARWRGLNLLGFALMVARDRLAADSAGGAG